MQLEPWYNAQASHRYHMLSNSGEKMAAVNSDGEHIKNRMTCGKE